jgi:hypothetical protein
LEIEIDGERVSVPEGALFSVEHEREDGEEELEFQIRWTLAAEDEDEDEEEDDEAEGEDDEEEDGETDDESEEDEESEEAAETRAGKRPPDSSSQRFPAFLQCRNDRAQTATAQDRGPDPA